jgi:hypothetical protein
MAEKGGGKKPSEDRTERRVKFYLGVFIIAVTFFYIMASAFSQGSDRPLALPDWKYAMPFILVAFVVVYQTDKADILAVFRIFFGGAAKGLAKGINDAMQEEEQNARKGDESS